MLINILVLTII